VLTVSTAVAARRLMIERNDQRAERRYIQPDQERNNRHAPPFIGSSKMSATNERAPKDAPASPAGFSKDKVYSVFRSISAGG
jgi:hypothetical protein